MDAPVSFNAASVEIQFDHGAEVIREERRNTICDEWAKPHVSKVECGCGLDLRGGKCWHR